MGKGVRFCGQPTVYYLCIAFRHGDEIVCVLDCVQAIKSADYEGRFFHYAPVWQNWRPQTQPLRACGHQNVLGSQVCIQTQSFLHSRVPFRATTTNRSCLKSL